MRSDYGFLLLYC